MLIAQLSAADWQTREDAHEALIEIGAPAIPYLEESAQGADPETRLRATMILQQIKK